MSLIKAWDAICWSQIKNPASIRAYTVYSTVGGTINVNESWDFQLSLTLVNESLKHCDWPRAF